MTLSKLNRQFVQPSLYDGKESKNELQLPRRRSRWLREKPPFNRKVPLTETVSDTLRQPGVGVEGDAEEKRPCNSVGRRNVRSA